MKRIEPQYWPSIDLLALDCDGVLTDGKVSVDESGNERKSFSLRDGHGIGLAQQAGIEVVIVTRSESKALLARAKKLGLEVFVSRDKKATIRDICEHKGIQPENTAFIGDDVFDIEAIDYVGLGITVADAHPQVLAAADYYTESKGGDGAVRELVDLVLKHRNLKNSRDISTSHIASIVNHRTYVIAEIGQNHQGSLEIAKELIRTAKLCGADAVKSQKRDIYQLLSEQERERPYSSPHAFGKTYGEHRLALELSREDWVDLFSFSKEIGIDYFASPWDVNSAQLLNDLGAPIFKIASASLTRFELLKRVASFDKPVILSTGMSSIEEIDQAVSIFSNNECYLLQCTSAYPASFDTVNLRAMETLSKRYGLVVGLSGHHKGIAVDAAACALGAKIIERHFTLDRTQKGSDHAASLEPPGLAKLVRDLRAVEASMGVSEKAVLDCELSARAKLRGPVKKVEAA